MKTNPENTCQPALEALISQMEYGPLSEAELLSLYQQFPACAGQIQSTYEVWQSMEEIEVPEPSQAMHTNFYKMLNEFSAEASETKSRWQFDWWSWNGFSLKWAVIAGVFILGLLSGNFFQFNTGNPFVDEIAQSDEKMIQESYAMLTSDQSATNRLQGIQLAKQMEELDEKIIHALNQTLLYDPNINVRLSAIETMIHFADNSKVRENLIRAIPYQDSPLVQLTLAEIMLALKDKRAINEIKQLLKTKQVEVEVKMKLEDTIEILS